MNLHSFTLRMLTLDGPLQSPRKRFDDGQALGIREAIQSRIDLPQHEASVFWAIVRVSRIYAVQARCSCLWLAVTRNYKSHVSKSARVETLHNPRNGDSDTATRGLCSLPCSL